MKVKTKIRNPDKAIDALVPGRYVQRGVKSEREVESKGG